MKTTLLTEEQIKMRLLSWEADAPTRGEIVDFRGDDGASPSIF